MPQNMLAQLCLTDPASWPNKPLLPTGATRPRQTGKPFGGRRRAPLRRLGHVDRRRARFLEAACADGPFFMTGPRSMAALRERPADPHGSLNARRVLPEKCLACPSLQKVRL